MMVRIVDLLTLLTLSGTLTAAYKPRYKPLPTLCGLVLCLLMAQGQILLEEKIQTMHFLLYILSFVIWGFAYAYFFLQGLFREKLVMVIVYVSSFFFLTDLSFFLRGFLFPDNSDAGQWLRIIGIIFCGIFLYRNAIHTTRKIPNRLWASMITATALDLAVYYAMHHEMRMDAMQTNAMVSALLLVAMMVTFFLCSSMIRYYETGIRQVAMNQSGEASKGLVQESTRLNQKLREYRHEMNNHIAALSALLDNNDVAAAKQMLNEMEMDPAAKGTGIQTGNPVANAILNQKYAEAAQKKIAMEIDASLDSNLPIKDTELASLLYNLLNNAIEGSRQVAHPAIKVHIYPTLAYLCISVSNKADMTALSSNPSLNTTKQEPHLHGFGLSVVREIADRYNGSASFKVDKETECFIAQVSLLVNP